jgi:uncharacterized protein YjiS (DUF1127 family)
MFVTTFLAQLRAWLRYRETVRELSRLTNRELDDLGINRGEIENIARTPSPEGSRPDLGNGRIFRSFLLPGAPAIFPERSPRKGGRSHFFKPLCPPQRRAFSFGPFSARLTP